METSKTDMISQLPEPIIHDILSCLSVKDSARTCVLSRTWRNFHATKPIMVFSHFEFDPQVCALVPNGVCGDFLSARTSGKKALFMDYVESCLTRSFQQRLHFQTPPLRKFDLTFCTYDYEPESDFARLDQWLRDVIRGGIHSLSLNLVSCHEPYILPHYVLSSQMLHELSLSGFFLLDTCIHIKLPSLKVLSLCNIRSLNDDVVKYISSGCPSVEIFRIKNCNYLFDLQLSSLPRLAELSLHSCSSVRTVEIGSPIFQSFSFSRGSRKFPPNVTLVVAETLRNLKLEICGIGPQSPFDQLSTFLQLEEFILDYVDVGKFPNMKISSQSLKRLAMRSMVNMTEVVEIECPNLQAMEYTSNLLPFHSLSPLNPRHFRLEFHLHAFQHVIWLDALKTLFENGFSTAKYPTAFIVLKDHKEVIILDLDGGLIEIMLSFLRRAEDLESTSRIIIASSFVNLKNEILTPMAPHMGFNVVSSGASNFTQIFSEKLARTVEPCGCIVETDTTTVDIPDVLRQHLHHLSSSYQITRIVSKWDWTI